MASNELTEESKKDIYNLLLIYTKGKDVVNRSALAEILPVVGIDPTPEKLEEIEKLFDINHDGKIQIQELVDNWTVLCQHSINSQELLDAFKKFDFNNDGYIRIQELKVALTKFGEKWTDEEALQFSRQILKHDANGDGKFDYTEFVKMYQENAYPFVKPTEPGLKIPINQEFEMSPK